MALIRGPRSIAGKLVAAAAAGAAAGAGSALLLDPTDPFAAWAAMVFAGVGALAAGTGVGAGLAVGGPRRRSLPRPLVLEVVAAAVVGGAAASVLLTAVSSTVVVVGGVFAALLCAGLAWWLDRQRPEAANVAHLVP